MLPNPVAITSEPHPASHRSFTDTLVQPDPGDDWQFVPSGSDWSRLLSITGTLATSSAGSARAVDLAITDLDGNLIAYDVAAGSQDASATTIYTWRPGSMLYGASPQDLAIAASLPGFWLPPGATVAAATTNLDPGNANTQAFVVSADESSLLPVTIVVNVNDKFSYTPGGGGGMAEDFQIAAGVYATIATMAAAINAAIGSAAEAFSTKCTCVAHAGSSYLFTAVSDVGSAGNGNLVATGSVHDAFASIFTEGSPLTLAGGVNADTGDQWSNVVATYVVAYAAYWATLAAMLDQLAAAR